MFSMWPPHHRVRACGLHPRKTRYRQSRQSQNRAGRFLVQHRFHHRCGRGAGQTPAATRKILSKRQQNGCFNPQCKISLNSLVYGNNDIDCLLFFIVVGLTKPLPPREFSSCDCRPEMASLRCLSSCKSGCIQGIQLAPAPSSRFTMGCAPERALHGLNSP